MNEYQTIGVVISSLLIPIIIPYEFNKQRTTEIMTGVRPMKFYAPTAVHNLFEEFRKEARKIWDAQLADKKNIGDVFYKMYEASVNGKTSPELERMIDIETHRDSEFLRKQTINSLQPEINEYVSEKLKINERISKIADGLEVGREHVVDWILRYEIEKDKYKADPGYHEILYYSRANLIHEGKGLPDPPSELIYDRKIEEIYEEKKASNDSLQLKPKDEKIENTKIQNSSILKSQKGLNQPMSQPLKKDEELSISNKPIPKQVKEPSSHKTESSISHNKNNSIKSKRKGYFQKLETSVGYSSSFSGQTYQPSSYQSPGVLIRRDWEKEKRSQQLRSNTSHNVLSVLKNKLILLRKKAKTIRFPLRIYPKGKINSKETKLKANFNETQHEKTISRDTTEENSDNQFHDASHEEESEDELVELIILLRRQGASISLIYQITGIDPNYLFYLFNIPKIKLFLAMKSEGEEIIDQQVQNDLEEKPDEEIKQEINDTIKSNIEKSKGEIVEPDKVNAIIELRKLGVDIDTISKLTGIDQNYLFYLVKNKKLDQLESSHNSFPEFISLDMKKINANYRNVPTHTLSLNTWNLEIPLTATKINKYRAFNGKKTKYRDHLCAYNHLDELQKMKNSDLNSLVVSTTMYIAIVARFARELCQTKYQHIKDLRKSNDYRQVIEFWLHFPLGIRINPDSGNTIGTLTIGEYLGLNNSLRHSEESINTTIDAIFVSLQSLVDWKYKKGENITDVYIRLISHIPSSSHDKVYRSRFTEMRTDSYEAFQVATDQIIARHLENYYLSLSNEELEGQKDHLPIPTRYHRYDFRFTNNIWISKELGNGSDIQIFAQKALDLEYIQGKSLVKELKSWEEIHQIGRGYTDLNERVKLQNGKLVRHSAKALKKNKADYTNTESANASSLAGLAIGDDTTEFNLPDWVSQFGKDGIFYDWGRWGTDPIHAMKHQEWVYYSMKKRGEIMKKLDQTLDISKLGYKDLQNNPEISLITSPSNPDAGISLIDRLGRNWQKWGIGLNWYNPGDKWGPYQVNLADERLGPLVRNPDETPSLNLKNAISVLLFNEPFAFYDENKKSISKIRRNPRYISGKKRDMIDKMGEGLIAYYSQLISIAIIEHITRTGQRIELVEGSVTERQLGANMGVRNAFNSAVLSGDIKVHNIRKYKVETGKHELNKLNSYELEVWVPSYDPIDPKTGEKRTLHIDGRIFEEPVAGRDNTYFGERLHGYLGISNNHMSDVEDESERWLLHNRHSVDLWERPEKLYGKITSESVMETTPSETWKMFEMERLLEDYFAVGYEERYQFRSGTYDNEFFLQMPGMLKNGEKMITNSQALWRLMPYELQVALKREVLESFTRYDKQGMTSNWDVFWDDLGKTPTFNRLLRGIELTGGVLTRVRHDMVLGRVQNPGTTDYYDHMELRPSGDMTNFGRSRFRNPAKKLLMDYEHAAVVNEISEREIAELFEELPNYTDTYKGLRAGDRLDYGQSSREYKQLMRKLEKYSEEALEYKNRNERIPEKLQGGILDTVRKLIHTPTEFAHLDFDGGDFDAIRPSCMHPGFSREYTLEKPGGKYKRKKFIKAEGIKITNKERFLETTDDFWTFPNHPNFKTLNFFDPQYRSAKILSPKAWKKLKSGNFNFKENLRLKLIKQFNPDKHTLDKLYNLEDLIIPELARSVDGAKLHSNTPFDGIITKCVSRDFPINYFADIFRLNYILRSNPPPKKVDIKTWKELTWLSSGGRGPKIIVGDIFGLAEYLSKVINTPSDRVQRESILKQLRSERFHRLMDIVSWGKIKQLRDDLISKCENFDFEEFWYLSRSSQNRKN